MGTIYAFADVGRAGLANLLIPWARAEVFRKEHNCPMLAPQWTRAKIGPLLRGERDLRYYVGLFNRKGFVTGLRRQWLLAAARRITEFEYPRWKGSNGGGGGGSGSGGSTIVVFRGIERFFHPLLAHRAFLRERLNEMLSDRARAVLDAAPVDFEIAAHVRRGDKPTLRMGEKCTSVHFGMPDGWFVNCIRNIRAAAGRPMPVKIFSDARPDQLRDLLALEGVTLAPERPSIVDILLLAKSRVLITTGTSTFGMWSSFLGEMPSLWYPGTRTELNPDKPAWETETDFEGNFGEDFARAVKSAAG